VFNGRTGSQGRAAGVIKAELMARRTWTQSFVVFAAGMMSGLALPPLGWWPVLFLTFPFLLRQFGPAMTWRRGFSLGWIFGFGYFLVALHWIGFAFLVDAKTYLWMMPFAVGGLSAVMAVYWGCASAVTAGLQRWKLPAFIALPAALSVSEWLRGKLLTGFPWAVPGLVADAMGCVVQSASVVGMTGLTLMVLLWVSAPTVFLESRRKREMIAASLVLASLPAVWAWGAWRETQNPTTYVDGVALRIVQPNISQDDKWRSQNAPQIFDQLVSLSQAPAASGQSPSHIVWPESAMPFLVDESDDEKAAIAAMLRPGKTLITGAIRRSRPDPDADYYTSVMVFNSAGDVVGVYDKWRLVPGGEFLPFAWLLEPLGFQRLVSLPGSFVSGTGPKSVAVPGAGLADLIVCYEVIFPDHLIDGDHRPSWIVNVTNDGWFGQSTGPYQHAAQARLRAVELGLPLVRAANTGISVVYDPIGRVIAKSTLSVTTVLDSRLPKPLLSTCFGRFGDSLFFLGVLFSLILAARFAWKLR
jgi:apolipoprotein N-acyltransferase